MEKNNPARRAGEKNNLAPILSEKNILAQTKNPSPPPPPEYQMDRSLRNTCRLAGNGFTAWNKTAS